MCIVIPVVVIEASAAVYAVAACTWWPKLLADHLGIGRRAAAVTSELVY